MAIRVRLAKGLHILALKCVRTIMFMKYFSATFVSSHNALLLVYHAYQFFKAMRIFVPVNTAYIVKLRIRK